MADAVEVGIHSNVHALVLLNCLAKPSAAKCVKRVMCVQCECCDASANFGRVLFLQACCVDAPSGCHGRPKMRWERSKRRRARNNNAAGGTGGRRRSETVLAGRASVVCGEGEALVRCNDVGFCRLWHRGFDISGAVRSRMRTTEVAICGRGLNMCRRRNGCDRCLWAFLPLDYWHDVGGCVVVFEQIDYSRFTVRTKF